MNERNPLWLEYRPDSLRFANGERQVFDSSARMLYNPSQNVIALELPGFNSAQRVRIYRRSFSAKTKLPGELREIRYSMLLSPGDGIPRRTVLKFFHPLQAGSGVRLLQNDRDELFFANESGAPLFSKDYTVRDVSRGEIDSDRAVWQFHGYKHEH